MKFVYFNYYVVSFHNNKHCWWWMWNGTYALTQNRFILKNIHLRNSNWKGQITINNRMIQKITKKSWNGGFWRVCGVFLTSLGGPAWVPVSRTMPALSGYFLSDSTKYQVSSFQPDRSRIPLELSVTLWNSVVSGQNEANGTFLSLYVGLLRSLPYFVHLVTTITKNVDSAVSTKVAHEVVDARPAILHARLFEVRRYHNRWC